MLTSSRRSLSYPNPATRLDTADVPRDIQTVVNALELDVVFAQGTHAARPAAGAGAPAATGGGRFYWETDTLGLFYDNGSSWIGPMSVGVIGAGSITLAMLAANSVDSSKIVDGSIAAIDLAAGAVTAAKIASALFPSQGAADATEAFRAIGTGAGMVVGALSPPGTVPICTSSAGPATTGATLTATAPVAGTYIVEAGAGQFGSASQGSSAQIRTNVTGTRQVSYSDVGGGGGTLVVAGIALTAGQVVTATVTISSGSNIADWFLRLTRDGANLLDQSVTLAGIGVLIGALATFITAIDAIRKEGKRGVILTLVMAGVILTAVGLLLFFGYLVVI